MASATNGTRLLETIGDPTNDAASTIALGEPYCAQVTITGTAPLLLHAWSVEAIGAKVAAPKNSAAKKHDDLESYVRRNEAGMICLPAEYLRQSLIAGARYQQDPRSPRKSAMDLYKAGIACLDELCSLGSSDWDYIDRRRVTIQRAGITRERPAFRAGWSAVVGLLVLTPEYISPDLLHRTLTDAGRLIGLADNRPSFGRYRVTHFDIGMAE